MNRHSGLAWLALAWLLLVAGFLLVRGLGATPSVEALVEKVIVDPVALTVSEPDGSGIFIMTLTSPPNAVVSIDLSTSSSECAVSPAVATLDSENWSAGVTVTVTAVDDPIVDGTQNCWVQTGKTRSDDPNFDRLNVRDVKVTVLDDDMLYAVVVAPTSLTVAEPSGSDIFVLTLTSPPTATVFIDLSASNSQCEVAPDLVELSVADWATGVIATVTAVDDAIIDGAQNCLIQTGLTTSADPNYVGLDPDDVTVTVLDDDEPGVVVAPTSLTVAEPSGSDIFTLTLTSQPNAIVYISLSASNNQCEVAPGTFELSAADWATGVIATVTAVDDAIADGVQSCLIQTGLTTSADPNYDRLDPDDVTVTVLDDDEPGVVVAPTSLAVAEPSGSDIFTLTLTGQPNATVYIPLSASNNQCEVAPGTVELSVADWATGVIATVTAVDDAIADGVQSCLIQTGLTTSADPNYVGLDPDDVTVTVLDDDGHDIVVAPTSLTVAEPSGSDIFTLTLTGQPNAIVYITLSASNNQCEVAPDLVELSAVDWATGVIAAVTAVDDAIVDGAQSCLIQTGLTTSADPNYDRLDPDDVTVTVLDDDEPGVVVAPTSLTVSEPSGSDIFTLTLTGQPNATVYISLSASNNQCEVTPGTVELSAADWATGVIATVTAVDDAIVDGVQSCLIQTGLTTSADPNYDRLDPDDVTVTVLDDDEPGVVVAPTSLTVREPSGTDIFTLTLTGQPNATVYIPLSASNNQCEVAPGTVELSAADWATGMAATVRAVDDAIADGAQSCLIQTGLTTSADPNYGRLDPDDISVTVLDDDAPGISVIPTSLTVGEPDGSDTFTVLLNNQPTKSVLIPVISSSSECSISRPEVLLTPSNWDTGVTTIVRAVDDPIADGTQTCLVKTELSISGDGSYNGLDPQDVTVTVLDDDVPGIVFVPTSLTVSEPDGSAVFTIALTSQPTRSVFIPLSPSKGECSVSSSYIWLTPSNWDTGVTTIVRAVDDPIADGTQTCPIRVGPTTSDDRSYDGRNPGDVTVSVLDDDVPGITVAPTSLTVSEPAGSDTFIISLGSQPAAPVLISLSTSSGECGVWPLSITLDGSDWNRGTDLTVTAIDDDLDDGTQTCVVDTAAAKSDDPLYDGLDADNVSVAVEDDDIIALVYLPSIVRNWPPMPGVPTLHSIGNADGDGNYTISWSSTPHADLYVLEEDTSHSFSDAKEIYAGTSTSYDVAQRGAARYYYRVKARNRWVDSGWSAVQAVDVVWEAEPNDQAPSQANGPIVSGLTYYGIFASPADAQDYFYFDLRAEHTVEIWLGNVPVGQDYNLVLRNANLELVDYSGEPGNADEHIPLRDLPAGRYYIQVYHYSSGGSNQPYYLKVVYE